MSPVNQNKHENSVPVPVPVSLSLQIHLSEAGTDCASFWIIWSMTPRLKIKPFLWMGLSLDPPPFCFPLHTFFTMKTQNCRLVFLVRFNVSFCGKMGWRIRVQTFENSCCTFETIKILFAFKQWKVRLSNWRPIPCM